MSCPLCEYPYVCPCESCKDRNPNLRKWIRLDDYLEACPCCGLTLSMDELEELDMQRAREQYRLSNQSGGCLSGIEKDTP